MAAIERKINGTFAPVPGGYAQQINEREVACVKRGIVAVEHHCRAFKYDPLKRVPPRPAALETERLKEEDFSL